LCVGGGGGFICFNLVFVGYAVAIFS